MRRGLHQVVTEVAAELMGASASNAVARSEHVVHLLFDYLGVDVAFLRHNDHTIRATKLIAQWPPPDENLMQAIGVVHFTDADGVFALAEHQKEPLVLRPDHANKDYQKTIEDGTAAPQVSMACMPLLSGEVTTGVLGFIKYGDREWASDELNALHTIASLFAQLQARVAAEQQLHYLAEHDDLTGLMNRRALITSLDRRLKAGQPGPVAVLFLDLDRLKSINDYLGHNAGDLFIRIFAERLRDTVDSDTVIARFGGDEFVVVPGQPMDVAAVQALTHDLQTRLHRRVVIEGEMLALTASVGIAIGTPGCDTTSDLLRWADQAALSAKNGGVGRKVALFSSEMSAQHEVRTDIELHLEDAIDAADGALLLHYLPEVDMLTGRILGAEALVRWQHPTRGLLPPAAFIPVAESINLAGKLGRLVMRSACAQFRRWRSAGLGLDAVLRVNVSPVQLVSEGFVDTVDATLNEFGLDADAVCLEITESVVVQDIEATRRTLNGLKDVGVQIAIDDFGTGYSVLSHLKSLPVDTVKIDRAFVRDLGANTGDLAIVRAILALADAFDLHVVAEGVETATAAATLLAHRCRRGQGFLLSPPVDNAAMGQLFRQGVIPVDSWSLAAPIDAYRPWDGRARIAHG